jgi:hypothetical protein
MLTLTGHSLTRGRVWIVAVLAVVFIAVHGSILYYASSHMALSAGIIAGTVVLIVIKHLGLLAPVFAFFRRHRRKP